MHTLNFIFLFFRLLNRRGGDRPHRPPGYATVSGPMNIAPPVQKLILLELKLKSLN